MEIRQVIKTLTRLRVLRAEHLLANRERWNSKMRLQAAAGGKRLSEGGTCPIRQTLGLAGHATSKGPFVTYQAED
jgi:hypothetical protein